MDLTPYKHSLIYELFVRTADENYITARWCAINHLNTDFLWLSVHALEKYLKAVLLANGQSSKRSPVDKKSYSHDIVRLYSDVKRFARDLLPETLERPKTLAIGQWSDRTPEQFMQHLLKNGNADNRYLIYGYITPSQDLHMLDTMIFKIRRLVCGLDERVFPDHRQTTPTVTNRYLIKKQPEYYGRLFLPLDNLVEAKEQSSKRSAALNLNFEFSPRDYVHETVQAGTSSMNPVIIRRILDPLESSNSELAAAGIKLAGWFLENVQVPRGTPNDPGVFKQIELAVREAKIKHNIA